MGNLFSGGIGGAASGIGKTAAGGAGGLSGGISPLSIISGAMDTAGGILKGINMGRFDYGKDNYSVEEAGQFGQQKAAAFGESIPLAGGLLGPLFGMIGKAVAEKRAEPIVQNRQEKMDAIAQFQRDKLKENRFFRNSDITNQY